MKHFVLLLMAAICGLSAFAVTPSETSSQTPFANENLSKDCTLRRIPKRENTERIELEITTVKAGELKTLLAERLTTVDALIVKGPINDEDYNTMWEASYDGILKEIDLSAAVPQSDVMPEGVFFKSDIQVEWETLSIYTIALQKIILPPTVRELGEFAFAYATSLSEIEFSDSLERIGESAFTDCRSLNCNPLIFPKNLKFIGYQAFYQCFGLRGEVVLPEGIEVVDGGAFYQTRINKINFPQSLKYIGMMAFAGCYLKGDIEIPDQCTLDCRGGQFGSNWQLQSVKLPADITIIPEGIFHDCIDLTKVKMPTMVKKIETDAFHSCLKLADIEFNEGLEEIQNRAFASCHLFTRLEFPSTLKKIGGGSFCNTGRIKQITCKATVPPVCGEDELNPGSVPFSNIDKTIPVYIPAGSREAYAAAWGWNYFTNFIETNFAGVSDIEGEALEAELYDLNGIKISQLPAGRIYIRHGKKYIQH